MRQVQLLGPAGLFVDGQPGVSPRGRKTWVLLGRLILDGPATREQLAELLVGTADDPLGALRWLLTDARRLLRGFGTVEGRTLVGCVFEPGVVVDALTLRHGSWIEAAALPNLGRPFLEGVPDDDGSPSLQDWLQSTRWSLQAAAESVLREAGLIYLGANRPQEAQRSFRRLLELDPFDEDGHVLTVRALIAQGAGGAARAHARTAVLAAEQHLGSRAAAVLKDSLTGALQPVPAPARIIAPSRATALAALDAGRAALRAGSVDEAAQSLRSAVADAREITDRRLEARAQLELGAALLDTARGREGEAAETLSGALTLADEAGSTDVAVAARIQLSLRELMRGRYRRAMRWIDEAEAIDPAAGGDVIWARALCLTEMGRTVPALSLFNPLVAESRDDETGLRRLLHRGRCLFVHGDMRGAERDLSAALTLARRLGAVQSLPLPEALLGHLAIERGDHASAEELISHAEALAVRLKDPCWQEVSAAAHMRLAVAQGHPGNAISMGIDVRARCAGLAGGSVWFSAFCLDALCEAALAADDPRFPRWANDLRILSARCDMEYFDAKARHHLRACAA